MNKEQKAVIKWCIASLTSEPHLWEFGRYQGVHASGVTVWIANDFYGMAVYSNPQRDGAEIGGVEHFSSIFGWLVPWRRRLRHAALAAANRGHVPTEQIILAKIGTA